MKLGKVLGNIVATVKTESHIGQKLMIVQPINEELIAYSHPIIAVDCAQSGIGDLVLLVEEGGSAREVIGNPNAAVDAVIVGVIDGLYVTQK